MLQVVILLLMQLRFYFVEFAIYAQLAQLVEQRTENPRVSGSIPELGILLIYQQVDVDKLINVTEFLTNKGH